MNNEIFVVKNSLGSLLGAFTDIESAIQCGAFYPLQYSVINITMGIRGRTGVVYQSGGVIFDDRVYECDNCYGEDCRDYCVNDNFDC